MKGWTTYTTTDEFAGDSTFREWIASGTYGQAGHPFTSFLADHTHLIPLANEAADLLRVTAFPGEALTADQLKAQIDGTWQRIRLQEGSRLTSERPIRRAWIRWAAAAAILLTGGLIWYENQESAVQQTLTESVSSPGWQVFTNQGADARPVSLSDGSVVWLEPGSELRFPDTFETDKREVMLTGEAFFEIYKNTRQPFFVKTRDVITRVVGTSFLIRTLENKKGTVVQVRTGQVLVYRAKPDPFNDKPIALGANQQLQIAEDSEVLLTEPVMQASVLSERLDEELFEFTNTPVPVVLDALSAAYGLEVAYDRARFQNCRITTSMTDEPLTEKLNILAETIGGGTRAELVDDSIRLAGAGCP